MPACLSNSTNISKSYKELGVLLNNLFSSYLSTNETLVTKIGEFSSGVNGKKEDFIDYLDDYIEHLTECCLNINTELDKLIFIFENIPCIVPIDRPTTTAEPTTTEEPTTTDELPTTTSEPVTPTTAEPEDVCDEPTVVDEKGSYYPYIVNKFLGAETGRVTLTYESFSIPDRFVVVFDGATVIDTGYIGLAKFQSRLNTAVAAKGDVAGAIDPITSGSVSFIKDTGFEYATVYVYAPLNNTSFEFTLSCPEDYTTTTEEISTTEEPTTTEFECYVAAHLIEVDCDNVTTTEEPPTTTEEPTTTTAQPDCEFPSGYDFEVYLFRQSKPPAGSYSDFTSSLEDACLALSNSENNGYTIGYPYTAIGKNWNVGEHAYNKYTCEFIPEGYYIIKIGGNRSVIYISPDGTIDSYPDCPTTTTEEPPTTTTSEPVPTTTVEPTTTEEPTTTTEAQTTTSEPTTTEEMTTTVCVRPDPIYGYCFIERVETASGWVYSNNTLAGCCNIWEVFKNGENIGYHVWMVESEAVDVNEMAYFGWFPSDCDYYSDNYYIILDMGDHISPTYTYIENLITNASSINVARVVDGKIVSITNTSC